MTSKPLSPKNLNNLTSYKKHKLHHINDINYNNSNHIHLTTKNLNDSDNSINVKQKDKNNFFNEIQSDNSNKSLNNNLVIKPLRKSFLIDSLLEKRQKKLAAAAAAIETNVINKTSLFKEIGYCDDNKTSKKSEEAINDKTDEEEQDPLKKRYLFF